MWSGQREATAGGSLLQLTGLSHDSAEFVYGMTQMAAGAQSVSSLLAAGESAATVESQLALSAAARAAYAGTSAKFQPNGVTLTAEVRSSDVYQKLMSTLGSSGLAREDAIYIADSLVSTGVNLPAPVKMNAADELIKLVPKGTFGGDLVGPKSPFFVTRAEFDRLAKLSVNEIASQLGLPAEQAIRGSQLGFDVYSMTPKVGTGPVVFESTIAPVSQGGYSAPGGAQQMLVLDRALWTDPNSSKIGELH
jgi:hypothetical protein